MILDTGICTAYKVTNPAGTGNMPTKALVKISDHWFKDLDFASSPSQYTDNLDQMIVERKIRILQNKNITNGCVIEIASQQYNVERVFHGTDELLVYGRRSGSGELISDLSLSKVVSYYVKS